VTRSEKAHASPSVAASLSQHLTRATTTSSLNSASQRKTGANADVAETDANASPKSLNNSFPKPQIQGRRSTISISRQIFIEITKR